MPRLEKNKCIRVRIDANANADAHANANADAFANAPRDPPAPDNYPDFISQSCVYVDHFRLSFWWPLCRIPRTLPVTTTGAKYVLVTRRQASR